MSHFHESSSVKCCFGILEHYRSTRQQLRNTDHFHNSFFSYIVQLIGRLLEFSQHQKVFWHADSLVLWSHCHLRTHKMTYLLINFFQKLLQLDCNPEIWDSIWHLSSIWHRIWNFILIWWFFQCNRFENSYQWWFS